MNTLFSLGLILLLALLAGHLVKFARIPEVTGYILAGVVVGPSVLNWVTQENLAALSVFSEVALGLILFSIGSVFAFDRMRRLGPAVLRVTLAESLLAAGLVASVMLALGQSWQISLLLGTISMETAAASTLMVVRESNASGPLSETLIGVIGLNNIFCLVGFSLVSAALDLSSHTNGSGATWNAVYASLFPLFWQLIGSVALGYLMGLLIASWATRVTENGETLILLTGCVLLTVGAALALELSSLIASLAVGATMVNLSASSRKLFQTLSNSDPPLYAIFFVIAGADLNLALLKTMGIVGVAYVVCRVAGKFLGARIGSRNSGLPRDVRKLLGFGLMSQAGLAVGLTLTIQKRFPEIAPAVVTVVLAAVAVCEMIGPVSARLAIMRSGEARPHKAADEGIVYRSTTEPSSAS